MRRHWKSIRQRFDMFTCIETVTVLLALELKHMNKRNIKVSACSDESTSDLNLYGWPLNFLKSQCIIFIYLFIFNIYSCLCEMHQKVLCLAQMKNP